ncbi:rhodoquinone biosynthesis methyltransferase RquA [Chromobacterium piscinae]|uniref:rhodoquinone biosynthesis methyltransferase RquA n=1 Tax=Chromobacterium piscinae TaxID=686831 RepID=UPI00140DCC1C|nr:rhodoquinone biosynthesis methyltransferase RquA [Chromobacterium piscinae]MBX9296394.1 rhodoquinone biosynthesis methyltransferase RquA [Chromobacterium vaccinii]MBX9357133.1 rhodoquinone biosynthesis methyltransferase RquA [Chromobacterium vaccinii]MCD4503132.1 rhodoquinone biosynthesis methyltransferase RquA [Chromobacterium piscinae]NHQ81672.1 class I SAM-dependent methyltransferase [Chromobacterium vaccinii]
MTTLNTRASAGDPYYQDVPDYMTEVYDWAYVNPRKARMLDHKLVVRTLLFGNDQRLMRAYLDEIRPGERVWQVAHVYGDLVQRAAARVGADGRFTLTDVTPIQVELAGGKLAGVPQAEVVRADAARFQADQRPDLVCSFFLLHEVPEGMKSAIVDNMLAQVAPGGRAMFVDYHCPRPWQPIGWLLKWVNRVLEPFAEALWNKEIAAYAREAERFDWRKRTVFGGVYQIVVAQRRD